MVKIRKQKVYPHKRRRETSPKPRRNFKGLFSFLFWTLLVACIGAGVVGFQYLFVDSDCFNVKAVDVRFYDEKNVLRKEPLTGIDDKKIIGSNIFLVDLKSFKDAIEERHTELRDIIVRRVLPNKLLVQAKKRQPFARINSERQYLVDRDCVFLPDTKNLSVDEAPLISGVRITSSRGSEPKLNESQEEKIKRALFLIDLISRNKKLLKFRLKNIDVADIRNISFYFDAENVEIKIGDSEFSKRLDTLGTVLEQLGQDIGRVKYIDLRFEDPIVGPR